MQHPIRDINRNGKCIVAGCSKPLYYHEVCEDHVITHGGDVSASRYLREREENDRLQQRIRELEEDKEHNEIQHELALVAEWNHGANVGRTEARAAMKEEAIGVLKKIRLGWGKYSCDLIQTLENEIRAIK